MRVWARFIGIGLSCVLLTGCADSDNERADESDDSIEEVDAEEALDTTGESEDDVALDEELAGLVQVDLARVVDGDTVHVYGVNGETLKLRLLLIDTPETVHPNKPVEPFGKEASARMTEFLNSHSPLYIEYDEGDTQDAYGRELVYLYAVDSLGNIISAQEVLLEEGLARVGYVYEQQRHLDDFNVAEQRAKDYGLGIWSIPGYVNEGGEGFNSEAEEEPSSGLSEIEDDFANCTELRKVYPDGVDSNHSAYRSEMDGDGDGWACDN